MNSPRIGKLLVAAVLGIVAPAAGLAAVGITEAGALPSCTAAPQAGADYQGCTLSNLSWASASLNNANLSGATLDNVTLSSADLFEADLSGATLIDVTFDNANLTDANLSGATLEHVDLTHATLFDANESGLDVETANFTSANVTAATIAGANFSGATFADTTSSGLSGTPSELPAGWSIVDGSIQFTGDRCDEALRPGIDLSGCDLRGRSLASANLDGANLSHTDLEGVDVSSADLYQVDLTGADLGGADLSSANLTDAVIDYTDFSGANLVDATFFDTHLQEANFDRADLTSADFAGAWMEQAQLEGANLTDADLYATVLDGVDLTGSTITRTEFTDADFEGVLSSGLQGQPDDLPANWFVIDGVFVYQDPEKCAAAPAPGVDLSFCDLTGLDLAGASLAGADLRGADLDGVDLTGADLAGAQLSWTLMRGATLTGADLAGARVEGALLDRANLAGANLTGAWLPGADLTDASLAGADLVGATITDDVITGADLSTAILPSLPISPSTQITSGWLEGTPASLPTSWTLYDGYLAAVPAAPTDVVATAVPNGPSVQGDGSVTVQWTPPSRDDEDEIAPLTISTVTADPGGESCTAPTTASTCTVHGLTYGRHYTFSVTAADVAGTGPSSAASNTATPLTVPAAPTGAVAMVGSALGHATISWTDGFDGGSPLTSAQVAFYDTSNGGAPGLVSCVAGSPCDVSGLTPGDTYEFTVADTNAVGTGAASSPRTLDIVLPDVPASPTAVSAAAGGTLGSVTVSWSDGADGGSPLTGYRVIPHDITTGVGEAPEALPAGSARGATVTVDHPGDSYQFSIVALNAYGASSPSTPSAPLAVPELPAAPTNVVAVGGVHSATVGWIPPSSNGGLPITSYTVSDGSGHHCTYVVSTPETDTCTVTGLTNGQSYRFTVSAVTSLGTGLGAVSNAVVPSTVPDAPGNVVAVAANRAAAVS